MMQVMAKVAVVARQVGMGRQAGRLGRCQCGVSLACSCLSQTACLFLPACLPVPVLFSGNRHKQQMNTTTHCTTTKTQTRKQETHNKTSVNTTNVQMEGGSPPGLQPRLATERGKGADNANAHVCE